MEKPTWLTELDFKVVNLVELLVSEIQSMITFKAKATQMIMTNN